jgi:hypothetical protein
MQSALRGELAGFALPDVLGMLHRSRRSGVLVLETDESEAKIFIEEGRPVSAHSTRPDFRLGGLLERQGKVAAVKVKAALRLHDASPLRLGQQLVASGDLTEADLLAALKVQASAILFDAFSWARGSFTFFPGVPVPIKSVRLDLDFYSLVMEGVRRIDLAAVGEGPPKRECHVLEALLSAESLKQTVSLTEEEWRVLFLVDGRRTAEEVCRLAGLGDNGEALAIVDRMLLARFLRLGPERLEEAAQVVAIEVALAGPGTRELRDQGEAGPVASVAMGSSAPIDPKAEDDRRHLVQAEAVGYAERVKHVTLSRLIVQGQSGAMNALPLNRDSYAIGRHRTNDIVITDPKVSGFHARLDRTSNGFTLTDLKSRNGTWINGKRIESEALENGAEIGVGSARLLYHVDFVSEF